MHGYQNIEPVRKAILIGVPGSGKKYLPGVQYDVQNKFDYLCSPRGGAWLPEEIVTVFDPTVEEMACLVEWALSDYAYVYFSGHGLMMQGSNFLRLKDDLILDLDLFNVNTPRQLIVSDTCRKYLPAISGIPEEMERWMAATGFSEARQIFNNYILNSPAGRMIIHGTQEGEVAKDSVHRDGGVFTLSLLKALHSFKSSAGYYPIMVKDAIEKAREILKADRSKQIPQITFEQGNLQVPLGISSSNFLNKQEIIENRNRILYQFQEHQQKTREANTNTLLLTAGIGIILWGLSRK